MPTLGTAFVNIRANLTPLKKGLAMARKVTSIAMRAMSRTLGAMKSIFRGIGGAIRSIFRQVKRFGMVATVALTGAVVAAAKFSNQLAIVSTMLTRRTMPAMKQFTTEVMDLAKESGQSTKTLTDGLYDILSAGIDASRSMDFLRISTKAAIGGITDVKVATAAILTVKDAYKLASTDIIMIADKIQATVEKGRGSYEEWAQNLGNVATTAHLAGMGLDELLGFMATVTRAGISVAETVTAVNATMMAFLKPQKEAKEIAKELGIELSSVTLKEMGFLGALKKFIKLAPEQVAALVGNRRAIKAMASALADLSGMEERVAFISEGSSGRMMEAYEKMADQASHSWNRTKTALFAMAVGLGTPLLGPLKNLLTKFRETMGGIEGFFKDNAATITAWGKKATDIVDSVIGRMKELFDIGKAEGLTAALKDLFDKNIVPGIERAFDAIKQQMPAIEAGLERVFEKLIPVAEKLGAAIWQGFKNAVDPRKAISEAIEGGKELFKIKGTVDAFKEAKRAESETMKAFGVKAALNPETAKRLMGLLPGPGRAFLPPEFDAPVTGFEPRTTKQATQGPLIPHVGIMKSLTALHRVTMANVNRVTNIFDKDIDKKSLEQSVIVNRITDVNFSDMINEMRVNTQALKDNTRVNQTIVGGL